MMTRRDMLKVCALSGFVFELPLRDVAWGNDPVDKLALIVWDGCERTRLKRLMAAGALPNLAAVAAGGRIVGLESVSRTCTKPAHAIMLTGLGPNSTRVYDNRKWQQMPAGLSVIERLIAHFGPEFKTFWTSGKAEHVGGDDGKVFETVVSACFRRQPDADRHPDETGEKAIKWIIKHGSDPGLWFIHFREPDATGHTYGEGSPEYTAAIIHLDDWLGQIMRVCPSDMALMVTTDHGFDIGGPHIVNADGASKYSHKYAPKAWVASNRPLERDGTLLDMAPTIYELYGMEPGNFSPPLIGDSLLHKRPIWEIGEKSKMEYGA